MARPRQGVTIDNARRVQLYFLTALQDYDRSKQLVKDGVTDYQALIELKAIPDVRYCDIERYRQALATPHSVATLSYLEKGLEIPDPDDLDRWVLKYLSKDGWRQCLNNLRQSRHANTTRGQKIQFKLDSSTFYGLKSLAAARGTTLDGLLADLLQQEWERDWERTQKHNR